MQHGDKLVATRREPAWGANEPSTVLLEGGGFPIRITARVRQEAGDWRIVNAYVSIAVPDATLEGLTPASIARLNQRRR